MLPPKLDMNEDEIDQWYTEQCTLADEKCFALENELALSIAALRQSLSTEEQKEFAKQQSQWEDVRDQRLSKFFPNNDALLSRTYYLIAITEKRLSEVRGFGASKQKARENAVVLEEYYFTAPPHSYGNVKLITQPNGTIRILLSARTLSGAGDNLCSADTIGIAGEEILAGHKDALFRIRKIDSDMLTIEVSPEYTGSEASFLGYYCGRNADFLGEYYRLTIP